MRLREDSGTGAPGSGRVSVWELIVERGKSEAVDGWREEIRNFGVPFRELRFGANENRFEHFRWNSPQRRILAPEAQIDVARTVQNLVSRDVVKQQTLCRRVVAGKDTLGR